MFETILCTSLLLNIIEILVIVKQNSVIREQNQMLKWALPIIDQLYQERHGDGT